jgi:hypothetical protein
MRHVTQRRNAYGMLVRIPERRRLVGKPRRVGRIILRRILNKWGVRLWAGFMWFTVRIFLMDTVMNLRFS